MFAQKMELKRPHWVADAGLPTKDPEKVLWMAKAINTVKEVELRALAENPEHTSADLVQRLKMDDLAEWYAVQYDE